MNQKHEDLPDDILTAQTKTKIRKVGENFEGGL